MADFLPYLSDTDESAVDDLISQAEDLVALDHISSLNLSSIHSSVLPHHLESRFQNLKSFPPRMPKSSPSPLGDPELDTARCLPKSELERGSGYERKLGELDDGKREGGFCQKSEIGEMGAFKGQRDGYSGSNSSGELWEDEDTVCTPINTNLVGDTGNPRAQLKQATLSDGPEYNRGSDLSPSPPRKGGCFWCLLKKKFPTKNKTLDLDVCGGRHEELLSDLDTFSAKEQRRVLKKAMKEQERLSKEAEKIVRMAKQASAGMP